MANTVIEGQTGETDEKSEISTNCSHHVCQVIRLHLFLPGGTVISCSCWCLQFKSPRHHEGDHLGVFWKVSVRALTVRVCPAHHLEGFYSYVGVVAWRAWDAGQSLLQQLICCQGEIELRQDLKTPHLVLYCNLTSLYRLGFGARYIYLLQGKGYDTHTHQQKGHGISLTLLHPYQILDLGYNLHN